MRKLISVLILTYLSLVCVAQDASFYYELRGNKYNLGFKKVMGTNTITLEVPSKDDAPLIFDCAYFQNKDLIEDLKAMKDHLTKNRKIAEDNDVKNLRRDLKIRFRSHNFTAVDPKQETLYAERLQAFFEVDNNGISSVTLESPPLHFFTPNLQKSKKVYTSGMQMRFYNEQEIQDLIDLISVDNFKKRKEELDKLSELFDN